MSKIKRLKIKQGDSWTEVDLGANANNVDYNNITLEQALDNIRLTKKNNNIVLIKPDGTESSVIDTDTTYSLANTANSGLMSSSDKVKLNKLGETILYENYTINEEEKGGNLSDSFLNYDKIKIYAVSSDGHSVCQEILIKNMITVKENFVTSLWSGSYVSGWFFKSCRIIFRQANPTKFEVDRLRNMTFAGQNITSEESSSAYNINLITGVMMV